MSDVETLTKARELIARPGGWTQQSAARDADGCHCSPDSKYAVSFCSFGAIIALCAPSDSECAALRHLRRYMNGAIMKFNDSPITTQNDVIDAFDRAIALAQAEATP